MFTGIIESVGEVVSIATAGSNRVFEVASNISNELKIDQSVSHNGVCLTVVGAGNGTHRIVAIAETLQKSTLGQLRKGDPLNLERCMLNNGRFDGHIVQGHVDQTGVIKSIEDAGGSWLVEVFYDATLGNVTVEKGSIALNGISLTCFNSKTNSFTVAIIPYTWENTNFRMLKPGDSVNLEFDIIGKYVKRLLGQN